MCVGTSADRAEPRRGCGGLRGCPRSPPRRWGGGRRRRAAPGTHTPLRKGLCPPLPARAAGPPPGQKPRDFCRPCPSAPPSGGGGGLALAPSSEPRRWATFCRQSGVSGAGRGGGAVLGAVPGCEEGWQRAGCLRGKGAAGGAASSGSCRARRESGHRHSRVFCPVVSINELRRVEAVQRLGGQQPLFEGVRIITKGGCGLTPTGSVL